MTKRSNRTRGSRTPNMGKSLKSRSIASLPRGGTGSGSGLVLGPVILSGPDSVSVPEGDAAVFHVEATSGDGSALTYQWQERIGGSWFITTDAGSLSGSTTDTLTIDPTVEGDDDRQFRCQVCNDSGCVTSKTATLDVQVITEVFFTGTIDPYDAVVGVPFLRIEAPNHFDGTLTPFVYSQTGTAWPAWAILDPNTGYVSGTPDSVLTSSGHTITATDTGTNTAVSNSITIETVAAPEVITFTGAIVDMVLDRNVPMTPLQTGLEFEGTQLPFSFSIIGTPLPPSLSINTVNGVISGTPDDIGVTTAHQVQAIDVDLNTAVSNTFSVTVNAIAAEVDAGGPYASTPGVPLQISAIVTPGSDPAPTLLWTIDAGGAGTFADDTAAQTTFTANEAATFALRCTVTPDDSGAVFDTAEFAAGGAPPVELPAWAAASSPHMLGITEEGTDQTEFDHEFLAQPIGIGTPVFDVPADLLLPDNEGVYHETPEDTMPVYGSRVVSNELLNSSAPVTQNVAALLGETWVFTATDGGDYTITGLGLNETVTPSAGQRWGVTLIPNADGNIVVTVNSAGANFQMENVTAQSNQNPAEYIETAGAPVTKYFSNLNGSVLT